MIAHHSKACDERALLYVCNRANLVIPSYLVFGDSKQMWDKMKTPADGKRWSVAYICEKLNIPVLRNGPQKYHHAGMDARMEFAMLYRMGEVAFRPLHTKEEIIKNIIDFCTK